MKYEPQNNRLPPTDDELPEWAASDLPRELRRFNDETLRSDARGQV